MTDIEFEDPLSYDQGDMIETAKYCTPLKVYLIIAVICTLIFYTYKLIKGHGLPNLSSMASTICGMFICGFIITLLCSYNDILAWVCACILGFCSVFSTLNYV